ncbi:MAG: AI-2E family transporter [Oscillospiraceae bacterium]|jgi:predicted PurR-regulated permease PerM|nr:AI-2E family transporter [Oscillospiraceae bacterium]
MLSKAREYVKYIIPFVLGVFLFSMITDFENTMKFLSSVLGWISYVVSRFVIGLSIAYILNFFVQWLRRAFKFPFWLAVVSAYLVLIGAVVWMIIYIVPYMITSVEQLMAVLPGFIDNTGEFLAHYFPRMDADSLSFLTTFVTGVSDQIIKWAGDLVNVSTFLPVVRSAGRGLLDISFGVLISFYALVGKDKILAALKRLMYAFMASDKVEKRIQFCREANEIFSQYVVGKFVDSLIIGVLSAILYAIFGLEMMPFLAILAFIFNMIPYFGPIIGMVITGIILLCFSPLHALYSLIISVVLQTIDGSVIGPKILGDAVGISPLLTIVAISVGGDIGGLLGIFLGVPVVATLKTLVFDRWVKRKLEKKHVQIE